MTPLLSVRDLRTSFHLDEGTIKAVDGVSFDVYPGQVVGIVGESGCGKSVLARSILRIVDRPGKIVGGEMLYQCGDNHPNRALGGVIDLARLDPGGAEMRAIRGGEIALIPQEPMAAFSPLHTVGNQIVEAIRLHQRVSVQEARRIAVTMLRRVGVSMPEERIDAYSWEMSGGLRQRAMIAMALACSPRLLIADEPTTAIDVTTQAQLLNLFQGLQAGQGMAMIFITHDLGVIAQLADHVVVMYLGRVAEAGPVGDLFRDPLHPYTRALLQSIPSIDSQPRTRLPSIAGSIPAPFSRPSGCAFHPRCTAFMPGICDRQPPSLQRMAGGRAVSCFLYAPERRERD